MKILVTGGSGFFGGYVMAALHDAGHDPIAYDIADPPAETLAIMPSLRARLRLGAIGDFEKIVQICKDESIEAIVHAAGLVGFERSLADPRGFYQTNIMGFVNVCEAMRMLKLQKLVLISSNAVYHRGNGEKLSEADLPFSTSRASPAAHYGTSKMASEAIGLSYAEFHGIDFYALRVTAIYGFGMRNPIQIKPMVENSVLGKPTRFAHGGPMKRNYTHVFDCTAAVTLAVGKPAQPIGNERILNVSAGGVTTGSELADAVRSVIPGADIEIGGTLSPLEAENVKMRAPLDCTLAKQVLGWSPRWDLKDGIRQYADQFRAFVRPR